MPAPMGEVELQTLSMQWRLGRKRALVSLVDAVELDVSRAAQLECAAVFVKQRPAASHRFPSGSFFAKPSACEQVRSGVLAGYASGWDEPGQAWERTDLTSSMFPTWNPATERLAGSGTIVTLVDSHRVRLGADGVRLFALFKLGGEPEDSPASYPAKVELGVFDSHGGEPFELVARNDTLATLAGFTLDKDGAVLKPPGRAPEFSPDAKADVLGADYVALTAPSSGGGPHELEGEVAHGNRSATLWHLAGHSLSSIDTFQLPSELRLRKKGPSNPGDLIQCRLSLELDGGTRTFDAVRDCRSYPDGGVTRQTYPWAPSAQ